MGNRKEAQGYRHAQLERTGRRPYSGGQISRSQLCTKTAVSEMGRSEDEQRQL